MLNKYLLGIDQSTQGTKALIFDQKGNVLGRSDILHEQIINDLGWVEHNPVQIYENTLQVVKEVVIKTGIDKNDIIGLGLTNQRETAVVWDKESGEPIYNAIVWQCARGANICNGLKDHENEIHNRTGLNLSPYFTAAKIAWILQNVTDAKQKSEAGKLAYGNMDSWLVYHLTGKKSFKTDYSNASRTELFNIRELKWDKDICNWFGINPTCLAEVCDSNALYGETDFEGFLKNPIPIHGVMGDSHGALYGQRCHHKGMVKTTYGTGSSIMMNIGHEPVFSNKGIVTSLAWGIDGVVEYVMEGNVNYTGAVISWLKDDLQILKYAAEAERYAYEANPSDKSYLVPAFTGLSAPYWESDTSAILCGMTRITGKAEIIRASLDSIAYQIADIIALMREESGLRITELRVDGGPTKNNYLMQFQSDVLNIKVCVPKAEELSVIGAAYMAGIALGFYKKEDIFKDMEDKSFLPIMSDSERDKRYMGWSKAVNIVLSNTSK
ncbi:MAG: glycerol kinase GlpK [Anaerocolumna sp.]|jgi:glycerol kinase|nr:glycerol kinase GlpK [Anaerocolumna sp.]